jgi:peptidoglycan/LPS O-acetylase OafA/YrhL
MPPPPGLDPRYETLDVWRGVACLMVVLHHSGFALRWDETSGEPARAAVVGFVRVMDLGVPLFFVISGYCIAASMDGHRRRGKSSWAFLGRRLRRIYPPYWAALLVFVATTWSLDRLGLHRLHDGANSLELESPGSLDLAQWVGNVTLTEMWRPKVWRGSPVEVYTRVAWSLCFEEQFYLVCFLALLAAPRRLYGVVGALTAAIVGFRVFAYDSGWLANYRGMFPELWHEFAVGLLVYWRLVAAPSKRARLAVDASLVGLLAVGIASEFRSTAVAAGFGLALIALRGLDEAAGRLAWLAPLRACGRRCYSIYLVHLPFCTVGNECLVRLGIVGFWPRVLVTVPLVSMVAVGAGWVFFAAVESRFLNPPGDRKPHARPVAGEAEASPGDEAVVRAG